MTIEQLLQNSGPQPTPDPGTITGFATKTGVRVPTASVEVINQLLVELVVEYQVQPAQIVEAAAMSFAMVIRYALGLSAHGGKIAALATDSLSGWVALATLRHIVNAGGDGVMMLVASEPPGSEELNRQLAPLEKMGVPFGLWASPDDDTTLQRIVDQSHNVLCGLFREDRPPPSSVVTVLNESRTPVHCLEAPLDIDPNTGKLGKNPLFASSTLSLGVPLTGLLNATDYLGRHYVADISCPASLLHKHCGESSILFSDQPVVQIVPTHGAS